MILIGRVLEFLVRVSQQPLSQVAVRAFLDFHRPCPWDLGQVEYISARSRLSMDHRLWDDRIGMRIVMLLIIQLLVDQTRI